MASSTEPCGFGCTCGTACLTCCRRISFDFFIRKLRLAWVALFVFFNEEYLIALVDFIAPCGGTIERGERDLRIPFFATEPRLRGSLDSPPLSLGNRCGGLIRLPRVYRDIGFRYPVLSLIATSTWCLGAMCSGWYRTRFSRVVGLVSYVFHLC